MLKSLALLEKIDKQIYWKKNVGDYPCFTLNELEKIKQDLEKYSKVMKLLEELFKEIETDKLTIMSSGKPEIIKYCLVRLEPHKMESMHINENTYNIVEKLKELVGDNHD